MARDEDGDIVGLAAGAGVVLVQAGAIFPGLLPSLLLALPLVLPVAVLGLIAGFLVGIWRLVSLACHSAGARLVRGRTERVRSRSWQ
jgi:hypothetical protein